MSEVSEGDGGRGTGDGPQSRPGPSRSPPQNHDWIQFGLECMESNSAGVPVEGSHKKPFILSPTALVFFLEWELVVSN